MDSRLIAGEYQRPRASRTKDTKVRLPSGRILEVEEGGDPKGHPVFALHGTPGSRMLYPPHLAHARKHGIRLIGHSRPGYGGSTRHKGRNVADGATDILALADKMGVERFAVWGHSGGGKYALACAALLPRRRLVASSCLSSIAPYDAEGLDFFEGMGELNVEDFKLVMKDRKAWERKGKEEVAAMAKATPAEIKKVLSTLLSEVDLRAMSPRVSNFLVRQGSDAFRVGPYGVIDDGLTDVVPWGFKLKSVRGPVQIWHGRHDRFCPYGHGRWLAEHVPNAEVHLEDKEGHISMYLNKVPAAQEWLASKF